MPIGREIQNVHPQLLGHTRIVFLDEWPIEPMIEPDSQRLKPELADYIPELKDAILSARVRNDTIIKTLVPILSHQLHHLAVTIVPVDLGVPHFDLAANTT
jgi:hypothetical protein